jgi:lipopolysaccharide transport system permease protein
MRSEEENWDLILKPYTKWYQIDLRGVWRYRDLLMLLVRRDFVSIYKQTILGPLWLFIQPIITTIIFTVIFGNLAGIHTDGIPSIVFYLSGITMWTYFADCLNKTSNTFVANAGVFGKVYFPRLVVPLSVLISNLFKLGIQFLLFVFFWIYYLLVKKSFSPNWNMMWLFPVLIVLMAGLGLGFGILISSLTTKYRDLIFLIGFGVQLMMYASPVVYPISIVPEKWKAYLLLNPVTSVIEAFKYIFLGSGYFSWPALFYSISFMSVLLLISLMVFNRVEKSFMDTV